MMNVYVDANYAHAVAVGANVTVGLGDAFFGERRYQATDQRAPGGTSGSASATSAPAAAVSPNLRG
jgi:type IV secretory pathway TrbL component